LDEAIEEHKDKSYITTKVCTMYSAVRQFALRAVRFVGDCRAHALQRMIFFECKALTNEMLAGRRAD
jgi:hypothetical protein